MCAVHGEDVSYKELEEVEKDIILMDPMALPAEPMPAPPEAGQEGGAALLPPPIQPTGPKIIRTIRKPVIELLCSQHNPVRRRSAPLLPLLMLF